MKTNKTKTAFFAVLSLLIFCLSFKAASAADGINIPKDEELEDALSFLNDSSETQEPSAEEPAENPVPAAASEAAEDIKEEKEEAVSAAAQVQAAAEAAAAVSIEETAEKIFETPKELVLDKAAPQKRMEKKTPVGRGEYDVVDHLPEAAAVLFTPQKTPELMGVFKDGAFTFQGYVNQGDIRAKTFVSDGNEINAVTMKLITGRMHVVTFQDIPPGSRLSIRYNLSETTSSKVPIFAYLRVLLGYRELKRIQISSKDPWKSQSFDLGIASFLARNVKLTFEVSPERIQGLTFSFAAKVTKD